MREDMTSVDVHVIFDAEGVPAWFGPAPVSGSERLDPADLAELLPAGAGPTPGWPVWRDILISHCRVAGRWQPKPPPMLLERADVLPENTADPDATAGRDEAAPPDPEPEV